MASQKSYSRLGLRGCGWFLAGLAICGLANVAVAGTITFGGKITQSTQDGTGPAVNNPGLNNIQDLQAYLVTLVFPGSITAPGTYNLTSSVFSDPAAPASESSFGSISLKITLNAGFDEFSLLGCLTTSSICSDQLDANFKIPAGTISSPSVTAIGLDPPHPLDLLEDGGATDIQGTITTYSNAGPASTVPEPSLAGLVGCLLAGLIVANRRQLKKEMNI